VTDPADPDRPGHDRNTVQEIVDRALLDLWSVANQLARIRSPAERFTVTIFGSSRIAAGDPLYREVQRLAERLARLGCDIVSGGGPGLMEAANQGAQAGDPEDHTASVGIRIALPFEQGANPFVERLYTHRSFFSRLHHFVRVSNAYVVMPGGLGTTLELIMVWQLLQVRHLRDVPLILVGDMWRELVAWTRRHQAAVEPPFVDDNDVDIPRLVDTVDQAAEVIERCLERWSSSAISD
jgi:uncharacterized protein (TIGR00730 family)